MTHFERSGVMGAPASSTGGAGGDPKPSVKDIWGMGNVTLGLMVLFLASVMVLTKDAFHGVVRAALIAFGGPQFDAESLSWEATYGALLRKIGKHPDGGSPLSDAAIGGTGKGGGGGGGGSGGSGSLSSSSSSGVLRERGRSANRDDDEAKRSLLGDSTVEMTGAGGDRSA